MTQRWCDWAGDGMTGVSRLGVVVLTYNSQADLPACLEGLRGQRGVDIRIVIVDNASAPDNRAAMEAVFRDRLPDGFVVEAAEAKPTLLDKCMAVFLRNPHNAGYSAGNNIGARLLVEGGCDAVLIVNPDVRITDPDYLAILWAEMAARPDCLVAASKLVNLAGRDEHPLRELDYWEELLWIRQYGPRSWRPAPYVEPPSGPGSVEAQKVHGSCLLIRSAFLEDTNYLDENVFLYCEEPILAARVRSAGGRMMVFPALQAVHAHIASTKGNPSLRMLQFIKSRLYYLDTYTDYDPVKRMALRFSYCILAVLHRIKVRFGPI